MTLADRLRAALIDGHSRDIQLLPSETRDPRIVGDMALAPAAVLVAITDRANPGLILTQRSEKLRKHAGQVAFPGGRVDPDSFTHGTSAQRADWFTRGFETGNPSVCDTFSELGL